MNCPVGKRVSEGDTDLNMQVTIPLRIFGESYGGMFTTYELKWRTVSVDEFTTRS